MTNNGTDLGNGLFLRAAKDEADARGFIALSRAVTGEDAICDRMIHHMPGADLANYMIIEDQQRGEVVSTTCLIPWKVRFEGVELKAAMLEMVVTHPDYRRRGLVRTQVQRFQQMVSQGGYDFSIIQGIPYYYRQYGYTYALDHYTGYELPAWSVPEGRDDETARYRLRKAALEDASALAGLYDVNAARHSLYVVRERSFWEYLIEWNDTPRHVIEDLSTNELSGYVWFTAHEGGKRVHVSESAFTFNGAAMAALRQLKSEATMSLRIDGSPGSPLVEIARSLGGAPTTADQWLLNAPDVSRLLQKLTPALEKRVERSSCAGITADLCINFYRQAVILHLQEGKLSRVEPAGFIDASMGADGGDLCIPPDAFTRLLFGYSRLEALQDAWPDTLVKPGSRYLLEVLFPKFPSWVVMPY